MTLPFEFDWGVETAIKNLRPGAVFQRVGIEIIAWQDPNGLPKPTWDEINAEMEKLYAAAVNQ